jgi:uncharacterized protein
MLQFVVKLSKYCNLRCTYCYEYHELGDKTRLPLAIIDRVFENVHDYALATGEQTVRFIWHGGEPFLIPVEYYEAIARSQQTIFGGKVAADNIVQTNLTVLPDRLLDYLRSERFFSWLGVSFDVYGDQRVDTKGRMRTETILANIDKLMESNVPFSAITVLARNTLPHIGNICRFFDQLKISVRFLPFYLSASDGQIGAHALSYEELVSSLISVFDSWLASEHATPVMPVDDYVDWAILHLTSTFRRTYNRETNECIFVVGTDGGTWGCAEHYGDEFKYGNLSADSVEAILNSDHRRLAVERAQHRMAQHCRRCPYFGACPGHFVGDASPQEQQMLAASGCPVRPVLDHIVTTLEQPQLRGLIQAHTARGKEFRSPPMTL